MAFSRQLCLHDRNIYCWSCSLYEKKRRTNHVFPVITANWAQIFWGWRGFAVSLLKFEFQVLQLCSIDTENIKLSKKRSSSPTYMHLQRFFQINKTKFHYDKTPDMITFFCKDFARLLSRTIKSSGQLYIFMLKQKIIQNLYLMFTIKHVVFQINNF